MCGRSAFTADVNEVAEHFALERHPETLAHRYNITPDYRGVNRPWIVRVARDGQRELAQARWWLIPYWWKKPLNELPAAFNARAETVASAPLFRNAFAGRRCIVPANAWYEFRGPRGKKDAYAFQMPNGQVFGFAGICDTWVDPETEQRVMSYAVITTTPNETAAAIHNRMPAVLDPSDYARWLDPEVHEADVLQRMLQPWTGAMRVYQTNGFVNNSRHEGPECLQPAAAD
jgi:putative SOS response-associated peptidase YedK